jgi:hypothetical protein
MNAPANVGAPAVSPNTLVLVDTNCLVRVYFSPLRPILGNPVSGYELKTLAELASELKHLGKRNDFAWLKDPVIVKEVDGAVVSLTPTQRAAINQDSAGILQYGNSRLSEHCITRGFSAIRALSSADSRILATALELGCAMATDEWPLRFVTEEYDHDDGKPVNLLSSVELLYLLESAGLLSPSDRRKTFIDWLRNGEHLLKGSAAKYSELFSEPAPSAQG